MPLLLIPSIDLRGGRCVRLLKGDFGAETGYAATPQELLERYRALGLPWLHVVDLDGARDGEPANQATILALAQQGSVRLQVGGGVRSRPVADRLLGAGVARVVVGSAAVEAPREVARWIGQLGPERVCLAFDVRVDAAGTPWVQVRGWREATRVSLWDAVAQHVDAGLRHVLCTDVERDGALQGPATALYREAAGRFPGLLWQASGGVRDAADLVALAATGAAAAVSGKALLEGRLDAHAIRPFTGA